MKKKALKKQFIPKSKPKYTEKLKQRAAEKVGDMLY